jgi:hypothetical protein
MLHAMGTSGDTGYGSGKKQAKLPDDKAPSSRTMSYNDVKDVVVTAFDKYAYVSYHLISHHMPAFFSSFSCVLACDRILNGCLLSLHQSHLIERLKKRSLPSKPLVKISKLS